MPRVSYISFLSGRLEAFVVAVALAVWPSLGADASAQTTNRLSVSSAGVEGNGNSLHESSITPDGRFVAFQSEASNLVSGDTNGVRDIFVRDLILGITSRVSVSSLAVQANDQSFRPSISSDGRFVAFESQASNLVAGDTNSVSDVFLHDRVTGETTRRSVSSAGVQGNAISYSPSLSANGQWLAFASQATTLVSLANNFVGHVFLHERLTGLTTLVSLSISGGLENQTSGEPSLSANGRFISFASGSTDLVATPPSATMDVYVRDLVVGTVVRASVSSLGTPGNGASQFASISADGRSVAFQSYASNLVPSDTNSLVDIFVRDLNSGTTERVSVSSSGSQANGGSDAISQPPGISSDGRYVTFSSWASNLVPGTLGWTQIYLRDRVLQLTSFISVSTAGNQATGSNFHPVMSSDGRYVVFQSFADNLVSGDTNGLWDLFIRGPLLTVWSNQGFGLAGVNGVPNLLGSGTLAGGSSGYLELNSARSLSLAMLFVSLSSTPTAFRCGTLVAFPQTTLLPWTTDASGTVALPFSAWPNGLSGQSLYFQYVIPDATALCGIAFSNAMRADVP